MTLRLASERFGRCCAGLFHYVAGCFMPAVPDGFAIPDVATVNAARNTFGFSTACCGAYWCLLWFTRVTNVLHSPMTL